MKLAPSHVLLQNVNILHLTKTSGMENSKINNIIHKLTTLNQDMASVLSTIILQTEARWQAALATDRVDSAWSGGTGQADHFLDSKTQFQSVQRVADADLLLYLLVWQCRHYGTTFDVGVASSHVPCRHAHPQLTHSHTQTEQRRCSSLRPENISRTRKIKQNRHVIKSAKVGWCLTGLSLQTGYTVVP